MDTTELLKKVRTIEIKSRGLSNRIFAGEYHSAFKGRGMAFSEVREYQPGDDIRAIDWNVTARFNHPFVKVFEEEREMSVILLVDVSASENFGSTKQLKRELITELCAVLAFSAIKNNDKIGVIFFSDVIELFIPAKKGKSHILRIIRELINFNPKNKGTNITFALRYLNNVIKKRSTTFIISDFFDDNFSDALKLSGKKHDLVALHLSDQREQSLPNVGIIKLFDAEKNASMWIDSSDANIRAAYEKNAKLRNESLVLLFRNAGVDFTTIDTSEDFVKPLTALFKRRERKK
ncbi:MAG: hypothetical protein RIQ89_1576 [Bacteroidota bacterium]